MPLLLKECNNTFIKHKKLLTVCKEFFIYSFYGLLIAAQLISKKYNG